MHEHLIHGLTATSPGRGAILAVASGAAIYLVWVLLSGLTGLVAVIRVLRQPAENWSHRNWSKLVWVLAILYGAPLIGGYPIPVGAVAAIWRTERRSIDRTTPGQLPRVEGSTDWPWPWASK